jgi:hypothetical protein
MKTKNRKHTVVEVVCEEVRPDQFTESLIAQSLLRMICTCNKNGHIGYFVSRYYKTEDMVSLCLPEQFYKKVLHHTDPKIRAIFQSIIHAIDNVVYDDAAWTTTFRFELNEWYGVGVENTYADIVKEFCDVFHRDWGRKLVTVNVIKPTKGE